MTDKPFVCVTWHDAADKDGTWTHEAEIQAFGAELCEVVSWGWVVSRTKQYVTLAADYITDTDTWGRITKIPRGMVVKIEEMKPKK